MTAPSTPTPPPVAFTPRPVLLVDDEPMIRKIAHLTLGGAGFEVAEAGSLAEAEAAIRHAARPYDVILLDLTLPDGDGARLIPTVRRESPATRVLVVSGVGTADAAELGADGLLDKPFTRATLLGAVDRVLNVRTSVEGE